MIKTGIEEAARPFRILLQHIGTDVKVAFSSLFSQQVGPGIGDLQGATDPFFHTALFPGAIDAILGQDRDLDIAVAKSGGLVNQFQLAGQVLGDLLIAARGIGRTSVGAGLDTGNFIGLDKVHFDFLRGG